jgi:hypothetical protein
LRINIYVKIKIRKLEMDLLYILLGILLLVILYGIYVFSNTEKDTKNIIIQTLVRQASRWAIASQQDKSQLIAVLHANYGTGYLWALKDIASANEIYKASGIDIKEFEKKILGIQDKSTRMAVEKCPSFKGDVDSYLQKQASGL